MRKVVLIFHLIQFCAIIFSPKLSIAQKDSISFSQKHQGISVRSFIVPSSLCLAGTLVKETKFRVTFQDRIQSSDLRTHTKIDDYTRYAPIAEMYIADLYFGKTKTQIFHQTKNYLLSRLLSSFITTRLKDLTEVTRPDGTAHSFPSGHTSFAFTGATALYFEFKDSNKFVAYSGFAFSTITGFLRITNNRHWVSDVIVGAGVGMFSTTLIWYINPLGGWDPFKKKKVTVYPSINNDGTVGLCFVF